MGRMLKQAGIIPDLIISSTAKRTKQTAKRIAEEVGYEADDIKWEEKLYHCIPTVFEETIYELSDRIRTVFIVAHNPGITEFVNQLSPRFKVDNMPTCGVVAASISTEEWNNFSISDREVFFYEHPGKNDNAK